MIWTCTFILANQYFLNIETYKSEQGHWKWCDPGMWPRDRLEYSMNTLVQGTVLIVFIDVRLLPTNGKQTLNSTGQRAWLFIGSANVV